MMKDHDDVSLGLEVALAEVMAGADRFGHREHIQLAWIALRSSSQSAEETVCHWLQTISARHGTPERFHRTLTLAWTRLTQFHAEREPDACGFTEFIARNPGLLDPSLPERHWTSTTLGGDAARQRWVAPDLLPLPG